jgi:alpha-amylase/alpha-mannosidase (GH57 family)
LSEAAPIADLVLIWHHHQPDYRHPRDGRAMLPWVRLHASKDYLDMALRLKPHAGVRATFNFVPSLLDQIDAALAGGSDTLFDLLRCPIASLEAHERAEVAARCSVAPRHAFERWPNYRRLVDRAPHVRRTNGGAAEASDDELLALEVWFLLAWLDPMFFTNDQVRRVLSRVGAFTIADRDAMLAVHDRLLGEVVPAYRELAELGMVELSISPYYHPILPLLVDLQSARRARPDLPLPGESFAAPGDADVQIARALERHAGAFGRAPSGMWPSEGSVSPEAVERAARAGVRWMASDEGVLWPSLDADQKRRDSLYRPWAFTTPAGEVLLFFRDHELSDRIGFVYQHWDTATAVADFLERVRRIARDYKGGGTPVVSVILDGENCWEYYPEDGGPFLDALYGALAAAPDIRMRTPSDYLDDPKRHAVLSRLHSGSWINGDFHIWIGHAEKNRAWELIARTRRALVQRAAEGTVPNEAWEALYAAEGSDWFWWFGDDHYTSDKATFDALFREQLRAVHERAGITVPGWLDVPIAGLVSGRALENAPVRFIRPTLDGARTGFYEWTAAGRVVLGAGGTSMHRGEGIASELYFGFDRERLYFRLDFHADPPGTDVDLVFELLSPQATRWKVVGLEPGERSVRWDSGERAGMEVAGAVCRIGEILELGVPFASLALASGEAVELLGHLVRDGQSIETIPSDQLVRFQVPDETFEAAMWSA